MESTFGSVRGGEGQKVAIIVSGYPLKGSMFLCGLVQYVQALQQENRVLFLLVCFNAAEKEVKCSAGG